MIVLVLAGGASNRFWPLRDKPLVEFGSRTLLQRHLDLLRAAGCDRFIVVARPETAEAIAAMDAGVQVAVQSEPRGMADAVLAARPALERFGDAPLYVTQAQDVVEGRLHTDLLQRWQLSSGLSGLLAAVRVSEYFPGGYLVLNGDRVTSVLEKPGAGNEPSDLVNLVAHVFASWRELVAAIETESATPGPDDAYERALSRLMAAGDFRAHTYEGRWQALKYSWHLLDVMDMLLDLWIGGAESPGPDYDQREDGVFIGRDVRILPGAYVVAPALIGHETVIGHNALVRGSVVGRKCVVGFGSEVARSFLAEGVELHHNYVGDSAFDRASAMGYGAVTANFRIDGRTVPSFIGDERLDSGRMKLGLMLGSEARIGVNASTMPGVKIGSKTLIGPNLRVTKDVPDGARVLDEETYGRF
jgi:bifunctional UDP-N-acetylglucosamine pyrophosphorylase/glucosamine-1-phosphate N-acetyltransferase